MKSLAVLLRPAWDVTQPLVQSIPPVSHWVAVLVIRSTVSVPSSDHILHNNDTRGKRSDAGHLDVPKRSRKVILLSEKVKVRLKEEGKTLYAEAAKVYGKNNSIREIAQKEKEIHASFAAEPQTAKVMNTVHDKGLVKMKKALNLYHKVFWETTFT